MPYSNFEDSSSFRSIYQESQEEDPDMDMGEFIFEKMFTVGQWFEGDENEAHALPKQHQPAPLPVQVIQAGSLYCNMAIGHEYNNEPLALKPSCQFRENKFSFDFHASVFHPPTAIG
jgi:hypothetical protein